MGHGPGRITQRQGRPTAVSIAHVGATVSGQLSRASDMRAERPCTARVVTVGRRARLVGHAASATVRRQSPSEDSPVVDTWPPVTGHNDNAPFDPWHVGAGGYV